MAVNVVGPVRVDVGLRLERRAARLARRQVDPGHVQRQLLHVRRAGRADRGEHVGRLSGARSRAPGSSPAPPPRSRSPARFRRPCRHPLLIDGYMKSCVTGRPGRSRVQLRGAAAAAAGAGAGAGAGAVPDRVRAPPPVPGREGSRVRRRPDGMGRVDAHGEVGLGARHRTVRVRARPGDPRRTD